MALETPTVGLNSVNYNQNTPLISSDDVTQSKINTNNKLAQDLNNQANIILQYQIRQEAERVQFKALQAVNKAQEELRKNDLEYRTNKNSDAVDNYQKFKDNANSIINKYSTLNGQENPELFKLIKEKVTSLSNSANASIDAYYMQETQNAKYLEMQASINNSLNDSISNYNNAYLYKTYSNEYKGKVDYLLQSQGIKQGSQAYKDSMLKATNSIHGTAILDQINLEQLGQARANLNKYKNEMLASTYNDLLARLRNAEDTAYLKSQSQKQIPASQYELNQAFGLRYDQDSMNRYKPYTPIKNDDIAFSEFSNLQNYSIANNMEAQDVQANQELSITDTQNNPYKNENIKWINGQAYLLKNDTEYFTDRMNYINQKSIQYRQMLQEQKDNNYSLALQINSSINEHNKSNSDTIRSIDDLTKLGYTADDILAINDNTKALINRYIQFTQEGNKLSSDLIAKNRISYGIEDRTIFNQVNDVVDFQNLLNQQMLTNSDKSYLMYKFKQALKNDNQENVKKLTGVSDLVKQNLGLKVDKKNATSLLLNAYVDDYIFNNLNLDNANLTQAQITNKIFQIATNPGFLENYQKKKDLIEQQVDFLENSSDIVDILGKPLEPREIQQAIDGYNSTLNGYSAIDSDTGLLMYIKNNKQLFSNNYMNGY